MVYSLHDDAPPRSPAAATAALIGLLSLAVLAPSSWCPTGCPVLNRPFRSASCGVLGGSGVVGVTELNRPARVAVQHRQHTCTSHLQLNLCSSVLTSTSSNECGSAACSRRKSFSGTGFVRATCPILTQPTVKKN